VLAARIADRAKGREILVSDALREYTSSDPTFRFEDRGKARLKGLLGTHQIHAVTWR
jgi:class 3 adenylate cyclase